MDDLSRNFPGCNLRTEEIRDRIRKTLGIEEGFFCYKCFRLLSIDTIPKKAGLCKTCYQFYCEECTEELGDPKSHEIDSNKCVQCKEIRNFTTR
jgi:hypothetical protein